METAKKLGVMTILCFIISFTLCRAWSILLTGNYHLHFYSAKLRLLAMVVDWLGDSFGAVVPAIVMLLFAGLMGFVLYGLSIAFVNGDQAEGGE